MKLFTDKSITKKIIILIVIILLFNFTMPNYVHADFGGVLFSPICALVKGISDLIIDMLTNLFVVRNSGEQLQFNGQTVDIEGGVNTIYYSPGIIFSGAIPLFCVNFIGDSIKYDKRVDIVKGWEETSEYSEYLFNNFYDHQFDIYYKKEDNTYSSSPVHVDLDRVIYGEAFCSNSAAGQGLAIAAAPTAAAGLCFGPIGLAISAGVSILELIAAPGMAYRLGAFVVDINGESVTLLKYVGMLSWADKDMKYNSKFSNDAKSDFCKALGRMAKANGSIAKIGTDGSVTASSDKADLKSEYADDVWEWATNFFVPCARIMTYNDQKTDEVIVFSSSHYLQGIIATFYKACRNICLVLLLTVLVYIGIRMLMTSTANDKAKYKKMLLNWLVAVIMLFVLQYIMLLICTFSESLIHIFVDNGFLIGKDGRDIFVTQIRQRLGQSENFVPTFVYLVEYCVIVVLTCTFTIQYLKRVLYMAFFTMIAPLIALTYPLDKIKDGQAQAFAIWLKEYLFNALLPLMHVVIYYMCVVSTLELSERNPIFAIVALGFMTPAEKFFRKMFGFDKATSASPMAAAAGGALMMNAINKMGSKAPGGSDKSNKDTSGGGKVRTKDKGVSVGTTQQQPNQPEQPEQPERTEQPEQPERTERTEQPERTERTEQPERTEQRPTGGTSPKTPPKFISGLRNMAGNRFQKTGKGLHNIGKSALYKAPGALLGATLGLAAGVASGDMSKAFTYATGGATALGNATGKLGNTIEGNVREDFGEFHEGAMGAEEYANWQSDKEFYKSDEWRKMRNNSDLRTKYKTAAELREAVQTCRSYGITDTKKMTKALKKAQNPDVAAKAIKFSEKISRSDWNDINTRTNFIQEKRISPGMVDVLDDLLSVS